MTNQQFIEVLFIDDEQNVREALEGAAAYKNIILHTHSNLDEGIAYLRTNYNIVFVILDAKGFINQGQVKGTENDSFAVAASRRVEDLAKEQNRYLPFCFYTGHSDLKATWKGAGGFVVFDKTEDDVNDKMFTHIWETFNNSEEGKLRFAYPQLFEAIDLIGHPHIKSDLTSLLLELDKVDWGNTHEERKVICETVRRIQEAIYKSLNQKNATVVKNDFFQSNGMIKFHPVLKYLSGYTKNQWDRWELTSTIHQNQFIEYVSNMIYWNCGQYIHFNPNEAYYPSTFGTKTLIYGVFELLIWFKELHKKI
jgi:hypothetical protein